MDTDLPVKLPVEQSSTDAEESAPVKLDMKPITVTPSEASSEAVSAAPIIPGVCTARTAAETVAVVDSAARSASEAATILLHYHHYGARNPIHTEVTEATVHHRGRPGADHRQDDPDPVEDADPEEVEAGCGEGDRGGEGGERG